MLAELVNILPVVWPPQSKEIRWVPSSPDGERVWGQKTSLYEWLFNRQWIGFPPCFLSKGDTTPWSCISCLLCKLAKTSAVPIKANRKKLRIKEVPIKILYEGKTSTHNPILHGISVILSTTKFISTEHPLSFYGIPGIILVIVGLFFTGWTIQYFTEFEVFQPILALIAIGLTLVGLMCVLTSIILFSLVHVIRERK